MAENNPNLTPKLITFTFMRTTFNTAHRMVYPYLTVFARALGVDLVVLSYIMTGRALAATLGPLVASLTDRGGRKAGILAGAGIFTAGAVLVVIWKTLPVFAASLLFMTLGKYIFDISMASWIGDHVPYQKRGRVIAITEFGWSLAFIVGAPVVAFLIVRRSWDSPFLLFACLGALAFFALTFIIPRDAHPRPAETSTPAQGSLKIILRSPIVLPLLASLSLGLFASAANETVNLLFGAWLEQSFGLQIAALGAASMVIGFSELSGEGLVALFVDRLGKPRSVALGLVLNSVAAMALPIFGSSQAGALVGLFFFYITFEFTLVSSIPLMTEILPTARAMVLALNVAGLSLGRAIGDLIGPWLYKLGFNFAAYAAVAFNLLALLALWYVNRKVFHPAVQDAVQ